MGPVASSRCHRAAAANVAPVEAAVGSTCPHRAPLQRISRHRPPVSVRRPPRTVLAKGPFVSSSSAAATTATTVVVTAVTVAAGRTPEAGAPLEP